jgi:ligand-binding sensor domain-containing protein
VYSGLNRYDPNTGKITYIGKIKTSSGNREITGWCSYSSHEGVLWVGTWLGDLYNMDPLQKNIPFVSTGYEVVAFFEQDKNVLWMGTSEGLIRFDRKTGITTHFSTDSVIGKSFVSSIYKDHNRTMWLGTDAKLVRYNAASNDFTSFQPNDKKPGSFSGGNIFIVTGDKKGSLLIGSNNGLDVLDQKTGVFTNYSMNPEDTTSLSQNWVISAHEDGWGKLWIGTFNGGGINLFNPQTGKFKHYLKGNSITWLVETRQYTGRNRRRLLPLNRSDERLRLFGDPWKYQNRSIYVNSIVEGQRIYG